LQQRYARGHHCGERDNDRLHFTNTLIPVPGSIQVVKNTVGGNGTFAFTSTSD